MKSLNEFFNFPSSLIQEIKDELFSEFGVSVYIKREDLLHDHISGNKWRKLKYNLITAHMEGYKSILTFGGAFSNHIYACAAAGQLFDFKTIGVIRGEEPVELNNTLQFAKKSEMHLVYLSRDEYKNKKDPKFMAALYAKFGKFYLIPEGGTNSLAIKGTQEILTDEEYNNYNYICCSCGTGGTIAGLIKGSNGNSNILGFSALKGDFLIDEVRNIISENLLNSNCFNNWSINCDYHFGGYAKKNIVLENFIATFINKTNIPLEYVYTGKMFYGIYDLIKKGFFNKGSKILAIHTGGLRL